MRVKKFAVILFAAFLLTFVTTCAFAATKLAAPVITSVEVADYGGTKRFVIGLNIPSGVGERVSVIVDAQVNDEKWIPQVAWDFVEGKSSLTVSTEGSELGEIDVDKNKYSFRAHFGDSGGKLSDYSKVFAFGKKGGGAVVPAATGKVATGDISPAVTPKDTARYRMMVSTMSGMGMGGQRMLMLDARGLPATATPNRAWHMIPEGIRWGSNFL